MSLNPNDVDTLNFKGMTLNSLEKFPEAQY